MSRNHHLPERAAIAALFTLAIAAAIIVATVFDAKADGSKWTGCYVGAGGQYSIADYKTSADVAGVGSLATIDGLAAQGEGLYGKVGCDVELIPGWVVGAFGDYGWNNDETFSVNVLGAPGDIIRAKLDNQWAVGGRVGRVVTPGALVYGLLGYTEASMGDLTSPAGLFAPTSTPTLKGYVLGAGVDLDLKRGWFLEAEYRFSNFDKANIDIGAAPLSVGLDADVQTIRLGLAYKFNFGDTRDITVPFTADRPLK